MNKHLREIERYQSIHLQIHHQLFQIISKISDNFQPSANTNANLFSSNRSVQGAVERILSAVQAYNLPVRIYMESTGIYHLPLYHRLKNAGLDVYILNPLVTHANQNINIRNIYNDKLDARRIALLGLRPDLKTSIVPADDVAAVKALLREYHAIEKHPDSVRPFGCWGQRYEPTENDYFRKPGWSALSRMSGFF